MTALCEAVRSALSAPNAIEPDDLGSRGLAGASKIEDAPQRLRIARDGEIIEADEEQAAVVADCEEAEVVFRHRRLRQLRRAWPNPSRQPKTIRRKTHQSPRLAKGVSRLMGRGT